MAAPMPVSDSAETMPDDILAAILTLAERESGQDRFRFKGHDYDLQRIFKELADKFPIVRKHFVFSSTGPLPYSPVLTESVSRLQLSGLIGRENPDFEFLFLKPSAAKYFDQEIRGRLGPANLAELQATAKEFYARVSS